MHENNCFITLTFNDENLYKRQVPMSLDKTEFQKFMKRLRSSVKNKVRFFHCGEYGDKNNRPHYHALLFNHDFTDKTLFTTKNGNNLYVSEKLSELWPFGFSTIGEVNFDTAAYCARYVMKKVTGDSAEVHYEYVDECGEIKAIQPEYCTMSTNPGLGKSWYLEFGYTDCHRHDFVLANNSQIRPPRYYDKLISNPLSGCYNPELVKDLKARRLERLADKPVIDKYDENMDRLLVHEEITEIRLDRLTRDV